METLKKKIIERLESAGFKLKDDPISDEKVWCRKTTITQPGASIVINGQHMHQPGEKHEIDQEFMLYYNLDVKDVETGRVDTSIMCWFRVWDNEQLIQDIEINFYPDEFDYFNNLCGKIFNI